MTEEKEQQMERLFRDNYERMYRLAYALLHDNEEAKDVVGDVFFRLWDRFSGDEPLAYLLRSVRNACINIIVKKRRDDRLFRLLPIDNCMQMMNESPTLLEKRWQAAMDCIEHDMTPQTASVVRMCYRDGCSYREVAEELGISVSAVNKHIVKGLRTLRKRLKDLE